jgi:iron(III) transport system ATP-binding protein
VQAVRDLTLDVSPGEALSILGPSGCGKSTTLRLIAGLERPDSGLVTISGETVAGPGVWVPPERRRVGLVFQDHALFPHLDVRANVAFGLHRWSGTRRRARVMQVLEMVRLADHAGRYPHELSGGEQQRVALARALAPEPAVVLLDEPFSNLDHNLRARVRADTMALLRETGTTSILVTHDQAEAMAVGDRILVMRAGEPIQLGQPDRVFHAPQSRFVATFMGDADFLPVHWSEQGPHTEAGPVAVPEVPADEGSEGVEVMVRPHEVSLRPDTAGGATVVDAAYLGGFVQYTVRLPSGRTIRSLQPHTAVFPVGTRVTVSIDPGHQLTLLHGDHALTP